MIITCPKCKTKYSINQNVLNKKVKCSDCGHIWIEKEKKQVLKNKEINLMNSELNENLDYEKDFLKKEVSKKNTIFYLIIFLIFTLLISYNLDFFKTKIYEYLPKFSVGRILQDNNNRIKEDLIFNQIEKEISVLNNDKKIVKIFGKISNKSNIVNYKIPMLKATLLDSKNNILSSWNFSSENNNIAPEETVIFNTSYIEDSDDISDIKIEFLDYEK